MLGDTLAHLAVCEIEGLLIAAGYAGGFCYCQRSNDDGETLAAFSDASTQKLIGASDAEQPAIEILSTGEIVVAITTGADTVTCYLSADGGESWTALS